MRDRLIELLQDNSYLDVLDDEHWLLAAEQLLAEGVIVPPCKVGDTVYTVSRKHPKKWKVHFIGYNSQGEFKMHIATEKFTEMLEVWDYAIGKTVFLTREEAEKALSEKCAKTDIKTTEKCEVFGKSK